MNIDTIIKAAKNEKENVVDFLREICRIPATSNEEGPVIERIKQEMKKVGFDEILIDDFGNILGRIGSGERVIAMDSHVDTVDTGRREDWSCDPYEGKYENGIIRGRGTCDQRGGIASLVYAGKLIKELNSGGDCTVWIVGSVCEEDSDGIGWLYILKENIIKPEAIIITEPTDLKICCGHRGRVEIRVTTKGKSAHASCPERGVNAIYKMVPIIKEIEELNNHLKEHDFLGKGSVTVSQIFHEGPSQCSVPDKCRIHLDRRLTYGETLDAALEEIKKLPSIGNADVEILRYKTPSWRGRVYPMQKYYPAWMLDEDDPLVRSGVRTYKGLFGEEPDITKWIFSTNGTATMGLCDVPTIGFGPGKEENAHTTDEHIVADDLVKAIMFYATFPFFFSQDSQKWT